MMARNRHRVRLAAPQAEAGPLGLLAEVADAVANYYSLLICHCKAMAKKKGSGKRRFRKYLKGQVDHNLQLGTLAGKTVIRTNVGDTVNERTFVSSAKLAWSMDNYTKAATDGPVLVGLAHGDYTAAEIEAWLENADSWNEGNLVQQEIAKRKIRLVGTFESPADSAEAARLNDGKPITTKLGWILLQGQTISVWAYNLGSSALGTTDPNVRAQGHANLWPQ